MSTEIVLISYSKMLVGCLLSYRQYLTVWSVAAIGDFPDELNWDKLHLQNSG
jgi:hypothetical protein